MTHFWPHFDGYFSVDLKTKERRNRVSKIVHVRIISIYLDELSLGVDLDLMSLLTR